MSQLCDLAVFVLHMRSRCEGLVLNISGCILCHAGLNLVINQHPNLGQLDDITLIVGFR